MAEGGAKTWFKYGCFGCLAVVGLFVLLVVGFIGIAKLESRNEQITERELTREVPAPVAEAEAPDEGIGGLDTTRPGRLILDLKHADGFSIEPAAPGEPIHIEARYDEQAYELAEEFEPETDDGWVYRVRFQRLGSGPGLVTKLKEWMSGNSPEVTIYLPSDVPLELVVDVGSGGVEAELGGLWITSAQVEVSQGGLQLAFSEPLAQPMDELRLEASMGGLIVDSVGNASPALLDIDVSMGGLVMDLRGEWRRDSEVSISSRMSGGEIRLPRDVLIEGLEGRGSLRVPSDPEIRPPTLRFTLDDDGRGGLEFRD